MQPGPEPQNTVSGIYLHGASQLKCSQFLASLFRAKRRAEGDTSREVYNLVTARGVSDLQSRPAHLCLYTCIYHDGVRPDVI